MMEPTVDQGIVAQASRIAGEVLGRLHHGAALEEDGETVHALRVATKRLRAAWHLVDRILPHGYAKERRRALAELSGLVSERRDREVLKELAAELAGRAPCEAEAAALADLAQVISAGGASVETLDAGQTAARLAKGLELEIAAWETVEALPQKALRVGSIDALRRSRCRAEEAAARAMETTDPGIWHDWRKAVKRLRYQSEILSAVEGCDLSEQEQRVSELGTMLGQRNDLANLALAAEDAAAQGHVSKEDRDLVLAAVRREERSLVDQCRGLGEATLLRGDRER